MCTTLQIFYKTKPQCVEPKSNNTLTEHRFSIAWWKLKWRHTHTDTNTYASVRLMCPYRCCICFKIMWTVSISIMGHFNRVFVRRALLVFSISASVLLLLLLLLCSCLLLLLPCSLVSWTTCPIPTTRSVYFSCAGLICKCYETTFMQAIHIVFAKNCKMSETKTELVRTLANWNKVVGLSFMLI